MANVIEEAKSGRASCRTCKKPIAKGELRLGVEAANAFGDGPSLQWHHVMCAAEKLPAELKAALDSYSGPVANRAELDATMAKAITGGHAKPGGMPYADRAPTGRAKCMQCAQPIEKGNLRVAIEREITVGATVQTGAGYLHPECTRSFKNNEGIAELIEGLHVNSRLPDADLIEVLSAVQGD